MHPFQRPRALSAYADHTLNEVLCTHLEELGWEALPAHDGPAALRLLRAHPIQLAILEVGLPHMDGIQVVLAARTSGRAFHVAFVDACERPEAKRTCLALGALAYMVKPVSQESVRRLVDHALRHPPPQAAVADNGLSDPLADLTAGVRVRLCIRGGPSAGTYSALVADADRASLVVSPELPDRACSYVSLGTSVLVGFPVAHGWGEFECRVTGSYVGDTGTEIMLSRPDRVFYRDRRAYPRVEAALPIRVWPAESQQPADATLSGQIEDIGPRGLCALLEGSLRPDAFVVLAISPTQEIGETRLLGRSVWREAVDGPEGVWHRHGFQFVRLEPGARQQLTALLTHFQSQMEANTGVDRSEVPRPSSPEPPSPDGDPGS